MRVIKNCFLEQLTLKLRSEWGEDASQAMPKKGRLFGRGNGRGPRTEGSQFSEIRWGVPGEELRRPSSQSPCPCSWSTALTRGEPSNEMRQATGEALEHVNKWTETCF